MPTFKLHITDMTRELHKSVPHDGVYGSTEQALAAIKALRLPVQHSVTIQEFDGDTMTRWYGVNMQTKTIATSGAVKAVSQ